MPATMASQNRYRSETFSEVDSLVCFTVYHCKAVKSISHSGKSLESMARHSPSWFSVGEKKVMLPLIIQSGLGPEVENKPSDHHTTTAMLGCWCDARSEVYVIIWMLLEQ